EVTVSAEDSTVFGSTPATVDLALSITDVNEAPTAAALANAVNALAENTDTADRTKLADIQVADDALGTNEINLAGADAASFEVDGNELYLKAGQALDFESQDNYDVTVSVEDSTLAGSTPVTVDLALGITDVNEPPTDVVLANTVTSLVESTDTNSRIKLADIQVADDALGTNEITLAGGDAASFEVDGNELYLKAGQVLDFESQVSYTIIVSVQDNTLAGSPPVTADFTLAVTDDNMEPVTLSGTKFDDLNANGQRDSNAPSSRLFEPGLADWTIRLYLDDGNGLLEPNADTLVDSATTDDWGAYSFSEVEPGPYLIAEVGQNGYVQTFPAAPGTHAVTATSGQDVDSLDFGNFGASRILTVNSTGDSGDANPGDGVAEDADGNTTLRAAIEEANAVANSADHPDAIFFAIPGEGPHTIRPATPLPNLKDPVILDATTQVGYSGSPLIELDGSNAGDVVSGLKITGGGSGSTIRGFAINRFDEHGIFVSRKSDVTIRGNHLGTDPTGTQDLGNGEAGVYIINAVNNLVHQNLISGNDQGIFVEGPVSSGNVITGNTIGTNAEGTAALKNRFFNIDIAAGSENRIGGAAEGEGNLISGSKTGVSIRGTAASGNLLLGNKIGTNAAGTAKIRNTRGVRILDAEQSVIGGNVISGNTIGLLIQRGESNLVEGNHIGTNADGTAALPNTRGVLIRDSQTNQIGGAANVISGNLREGIKIFGSSTNNVVGGNHIGTNAAGDAAVGDDTGVRISGLASANTIGGTAAADRNVISGNVDEGLLLTADNNTVIGNFIGIDATGTAALGNDEGVLIYNTADILIGGEEDGAGNVISGNDGDGIRITGKNSADNTIAGNLIGTNAAGDAAVGNKQGIKLESVNNTIGGNAPGAGNVISGNSINGIILRVGASGTTIAGNRIGLSAAGDDSVGNRIGVLIEHTADNAVGGTAAGAGNSIGGNKQQGIKITGPAATGNHIRGNAIGFDRQTGTVVANLDGVRLTEGAS
ncbi:MAG: right-handed parallel beta-helix repeat-containing protein, partial [Pirellulales bacterium]